MPYPAPWGTHLLFRLNEGDPIAFFKVETEDEYFRVLEDDTLLNMKKEKEKKIKKKMKKETRKQKSNKGSKDEIWEILKAPVRTTPPPLAWWCWCIYKIQLVFLCIKFLALLRFVNNYVHGQIPLTNSSSSKNVKYLKPFYEFMATA